jgi:hypothetical protein
MLIPFTATMLLFLAVTVHWARAANCDPLPVVPIAGVRTTLVGDHVRTDRVLDGTASIEELPLVFAEVRLYSGKKLVQVTATDAQGHFLLEDLPLGRYTLTLENLGSFRIEVTRRHFPQQVYYGFSKYHGCLGWGADSD